VQAFLGWREAFELSGEGTDPLANYVSPSGQSCAWLSDQANPTLDRMTIGGGYRRGAVGQPRVDLSDVSNSSSMYMNV